MNGDHSSPMYSIFGPYLVLELISCVPISERAFIEAQGETLGHGMSKSKALKELVN